MKNDMEEIFRQMALQQLELTKPKPPAAEPEPEPEIPLKPKHEIFVKEMILHGNKTRAYKAAYGDVTDESARVRAAALLKDPAVSQRLSKSWQQIHLGIQEDKAAFINQELKIVLAKRALLLDIINGKVRARLTEVLKAIKLDTELAEQQSLLLGYGSLKNAAQPQPLLSEKTDQPEQEAEPAAGEPSKNENSVTKRNIFPANPYIIPLQKAPSGYPLHISCAQHQAPGVYPNKKSC